MKNHWLDKKKRTIKVLDNTKMASIYEKKEHTEPTVVCKIDTGQPGDFQEKMCELNDHFWYDRLNRQMSQSSEPLKGWFQPESTTIKFAPGQIIHLKIGDYRKTFCPGEPGQ